MPGLEPGGSPGFIRPVLVQPPAASTPRLLPADSERMGPGAAARLRGPEACARVCGWPG
jgi:hypothetical protein